MKWTEIKDGIARNKLSLSVCFAACTLAVVGIVFETWLVIVPLILVAYWLAASQVTRELIDRREATDAQDAHQPAAREYAHRNMEDRRSPRA